MEATPDLRSWLLSWVSNFHMKMACMNIFYCNLFIDGKVKTGYFIFAVEAVNNFYLPNIPIIDLLTTHYSVKGIKIMIYCNDEKYMCE